MASIKLSVETQGLLDVLAFAGVITLYIWAVLPATGGDPGWNTAFILLAVAVAVFSVWRWGGTRERIGLRLDNFPRAIVAYLAAALPYAGAFLLWNHGSLVRGEGWPDFGGAAGTVGWAFLQQFCLLAFLLTRLRGILGRDFTAAVSAAAIFAFFHLPNPFLTLYSFGGGLIVCLLFLRWPSLPAAALAHAMASALVSGLLPGEITGWMKVGPLYLWCLA